MATKRDLFRGAFSELTGAGDPTSFTIQGNLGVAPLENVWETVRIDCLTIERWPWTLVRSPVPGILYEGGDYRYRYPLLSLDPRPIGAGPIGVFESMRSKDAVVGWELRDNEVLYDGEAQIWITYQYDTPPTAWPDQFSEYVRLRLCEATAFTYSGSPELRADFQRRANDKRGEVVDSMQQTVPPKPLFTRFATIAARGTGFGQEPIEYSIDDQGRQRAL